MSKAASQYEKRKASGQRAVNLIMSAEQHMALKNAAEIAGMSMAGYIAATCFGDDASRKAREAAAVMLEAAKTAKPPALSKEAKEGLDRLGKIGRQCHDMQAARRRMEETFASIRICMEHWSADDRAAIEKALAGAARAYESSSDAWLLVDPALKEVANAIRGRTATSAAAVVDNSARTAIPKTVAEAKAAAAAKEKAEAEAKAKAEAEAAWNAAWIKLSTEAVPFVQRWGENMFAFNANTEVVRTPDDCYRWMQEAKRHGCEIVFAVADAKVTLFVNTAGLDKADRREAVSRFLLSNRLIHNGFIGIVKKTGYSGSTVNAGMVSAMITMRENDLMIYVSENDGLFIPAEHAEVAVKALRAKGLVQP